MLLLAGKYCETEINVILIVIGMLQKAQYQQGLAVNYIKKSYLS
ncbi:hypothetical protein [Mucilaginibacter sp. FT3.2]|nr:hypothetical protein [Mucilaginibacter sp. FT3.2]MBB6233780.1 hypothetical protein [Mucilaginibacter sp. FT3.2]